MKIQFFHILTGHLFICFHLILDGWSYSSTEIRCRGRRLISYFTRGWRFSSRSSSWCPSWSFLFGRLRHTSTDLLLSFKCCSSSCPSSNYTNKCRTKAYHEHSRELACRDKTTPNSWLQNALTGFQELFYGKLKGRRKTWSLRSTLLKE